MDKTKSDWYVIVNPHAGSGKTMALWAEAEERMASLSIPYKAVLTNRKFHAKALAEEAAAVGYRRILAVGGDGSIHEVFTGVLSYAFQNGIDPEEFYLGVIPIGSGNDWVRTTGVSHNIEKVVDLIANESFMTQDTVLVESEGATCYMANIGGVGFDSHVCDAVNTLKEQGKRSKRIYYNALLHTAFRTKAFQAEIICDGIQVFSGDIYSISIGNGKYSGGGMVQTPSAVINDGLLEVMIAPKMKLSYLLRSLPRLLDGTIEKSDKVLFASCRELVVRQLQSPRAISDPMIVEMDGEIEGVLPVRVSITGRQVNVLCSPELSR